MIEHCFFLLKEVIEEKREFILAMLMNLSHFENGKKVYEIEEN